MNGVCSVWSFKVQPVQCTEHLTLPSLPLLSCLFTRAAFQRCLQVSCSVKAVPLGIFLDVR